MYNKLAAQGGGYLTILATVKGLIGPFEATTRGIQCSNSD